MGRAADAGGRDFWVKQLDNSVSRKLMMSQFLGSDEFRNICADFGIPVGQLNITESRDRNANMTMFVHRKYDIFFGRKPDVGGLNFWTGRMLNNGMSGSEVAASFVLSDEFRNMGLSDENFVRYMYRGMMGREADTGGVNFWLGQIRSAPTQEQGRMAVFNGFAHSDEFAKICRDFGVRAV